MGNITNFFKNMLRVAIPVAILTFGSGCGRQFLKEYSEQNQQIYKDVVQLVKEKGKPYRHIQKVKIQGVKKEDIKKDTIIRLGEIAKSFIYKYSHDSIKKFSIEFWDNEYHNGKVRNHKCLYLSKYVYPVNGVDPFSIKCFKDNYCDGLNFIRGDKVKEVTILPPNNFWYTSKNYLNARKKKKLEYSKEYTEILKEIMHYERVPGY
jgi:hypothetical protein